jgi:hypothetical protein
LITSGVGIEFPLGAGALFGEIVGMRLAHCRDDRLGEYSASSKVQTLRRPALSRASGPPCSIMLFCR